MSFNGALHGTCRVVVGIRFVGAKLCHFSYQIARAFPTLQSTSHIREVFLRLGPATSLPELVRNRDGRERRRSVSLGVAWKVLQAIVRGVSCRRMDVAHVMRLLVLAIPEPWDTKNSGTIGGGRVCSVSGSHGAKELFGLMLLEIPHTPDNLKLVGRRLEYMVRLWYAGRG